MSSWTRHVARSLFGIGARPDPAQPAAPVAVETRIEPRVEPRPTSAPEPPPVAPPPPPVPVVDAALIRACTELAARQVHGGQDLAAVPEGAWRQFADAVIADDGAQREAIARVADMPAESIEGLRAKAAAMQSVLDGASDDAELVTRIARSLIDDTLTVLPDPAEIPR